MTADPTDRTEREHTMGSSEVTKRIDNELAEEFRYIAVVVAGRAEIYDEAEHYRIHTTLRSLQLRIEKEAERFAKRAGWGSE